MEQENNRQKEGFDYRLRIQEQIDSKTKKVFLHRGENKEDFLEHNWKFFAVENCSC